MTTRTKRHCLISVGIVTTAICVALSVSAGCSSDDANGTGGNQQDAGLPDYPCLTACDPSADAGASSCRPYEECHNTGAGGYCVPPEDLLVPPENIERDYSCLTPCGQSDAGNACLVAETCEQFNNEGQSFCVPAEVPCEPGEIAVSGFGCLAFCDLDGTDECQAGEACRELDGFDRGACFPVDAG